MTKRKTSVRHVGSSENFTENLATACTALVVVIGKLLFPGPKKFSAALVVVLASHVGKNLKK